MCVCVLGVEGVAWDLGRGWGGGERGWGFGKGREGATMEMRSRRLKGTTIPTIPEWWRVETATPSSCEIFHTDRVQRSQKGDGLLLIYLFIYFLNGPFSEKEINLVQHFTWTKVSINLSVNA